MTSNEPTKVDLSKVRGVKFDPENKYLHIRLNDKSIDRLKYESLDEVVQFLNDLKQYHTYVVVRTQLVLLMIAAGVCVLVGWF